MAFACGFRTIIEDMSQMATAATAMNLGALGEECVILSRANSAGERGPKAGPAGAGFKLCARRVNGKIAARAMVIALPRFLQQR